MKYLMTLALLGLATPASAEVVSSSSNGFEVSETVNLVVKPDAAMTAFLNVAAWWDPEHTFSGKASNLSLDAKAGGCFCETLPNGGSVRHLSVVFAAPGKMLRLNGGLGPMQDMGVAGSLTFALSEAAGKTTIVLTYKVGGYLAGGLDAMAKPADGMLSGSMQRLKRFIDTGTP